MNSEDVADAAEFDKSIKHPEVTVVDNDEDEVEEVKVNVSRPADESKQADTSEKKRPIAIDVDEDEDEPTPKRPVSGNPYSLNYCPSFRQKVTHLRNLPEVNKCGREEGCGSLTKKERALLTTFFEKHPRRMTIELKEDCSFLKLFAWSPRTKEDTDTVGYVLRVGKIFKCEDAFLSYLLHDPESGSPFNLNIPRMEICRDSDHKTHYLHIRTAKEERPSLKTFLQNSLGAQIRFYLWDAWDTGNIYQYKVALLIVVISISCDPI